MSDTNDATVTTGTLPAQAITAAQAEADGAADADTPKPWEQQIGEPDLSFSYYLHYRNLGPTRTLVNAYEAYRASFANAVREGGGGAPAAWRKLTVPGNWVIASSRWGWIARAVKWDIAQLEDCGSRVYTIWMSLVFEAAEKCASRLAEPGCRPKDFAQACAFIRDLGAVLNPEATRAIRQEPAGNDTGDGERGRRRKRDIVAVE